MIDGMVRKYRSILGSDAHVVATGGYAASILPFCETEIVHDPNLLMDGLYAIYKKNNPQ
jgi:type III pantothenate kinase